VFGQFLGGLPLDGSLLSRDYSTACVTAICYSLPV